MKGKPWYVVLAVFVLFGSAVAGHAAEGDVPLRDNVGIAQVSGGDTGNVFWRLELGNDEFRRALTRALDKVGLLERARGEGQFALSVVLERLEQATAGFAASARVRYTLVDKRCAKEVFRQTISGDYSTEMWDSFMNPGIGKRLAEGAVRVNASILAEQLLGLSLFQEAVSSSE